MGGSRKTVRELSSALLFPQNKDLYNEDLMRIVGANGMHIDIPTILQSMQINMQFVLNETAFNRFGVNAYSTMEIKEYTDEAILAYIKSHIDNSAQEFICKNVSDSYYKQTLAWLEDKQTINTCSSTIDEPLQCDGGSIANTVELDGFRENNKDYKIIIQDNKVLTKEEDGLFYIGAHNCTDNIDEWIEAPKDDRLVWVVHYRKEDGTTNTVYIFRENVSHILKRYDVLIVPLKKDGSWQGDNKYIRFVLNRFGLGSKGNQDSGLKESLDNNYIKDAFITYATKDRNGYFKPYIDAIYGLNNENLITINSFVDIEYNNGKIKVNGKEKKLPLEDENENHTPSWIIPHGLLKFHGLKSKYKVYKELFSLFVYLEKTIKLKWYQTWIFKFFALILGIGLAWLTGGSSLALITAGISIAGLAISMINPKLSIIFDIILAIETFGTSGSSLLSRILTNVNNIFTIGSKLYNIYIGDKIKDIAKELSRTTKEQQQLEKELNEMKDRMLYVSFDDVIDMQYDLMYDNYDMLYDYERFFELPKGAKNEF